MTFDSLGDRMKDNYESRTQSRLLRRSYNVIRIDGKAFHTFTRGMEKPFDVGLIENMNSTAEDLCKDIQNSVIGYVQSDEISILMADFNTLQTDAWYDGNVQKIVSVAASIATASFNKHKMQRELRNGSIKSIPIMAKFDARVFTLPNKEEVINYFIWRQQDATRNSISSVAQSMFSHKELHGKSTNEMQEMIFQKSGKNWNDYPVGQKRGRTVAKRLVTKKHMVPVDWNNIEKDEWREEEQTRSEWLIEDPPIFTQEPNYLGTILNNIEEKMER